jgi:hypothetical protein
MSDAGVELQKKRHLILTRKNLFHRRSDTRNGVVNSGISEISVERVAIHSCNQMAY